MFLACCLNNNSFSLYPFALCTRAITFFIIDYILIKIGLIIILCSTMVVFVTKYRNDNCLQSSNLIVSTSKSTVRVVWDCSLFQWNALLIQYGKNNDIEIISNEKWLLILKTLAKLFEASTLGFSKEGRHFMPVRQPCAGHR